MILETLMSISHPVLLISDHGPRFTSCAHIGSNGKLENTIPRLTKVFFDYKQWKEESKGLGSRAKKAITQKGNLMYIILP